MCGTCLDLQDKHQHLKLMEFTEFFRAEGKQLYLFFFFLIWVVIETHQPLELQVNSDALILPEDQTALSDVKEQCH